MTYEAFCGGLFETNCYLLEAPEGWILFDAPEGACDWLETRQVDLKLLLLTHGHIDHIQDVAKIKRKFNCPIGCHAETAPMISDREFFRPAFVSSRAKTNCSSAAMSFSPAASAAGICPVAMSIFCSEELRKNY